MVTNDMVTSELPLGSEKVRLVTLPQIVCKQLESN